LCATLLLKKKEFAGLEQKEKKAVPVKPGSKDRQGKKEEGISAAGGR